MTTPDKPSTQVNPSRRSLDEHESKRLLAAHGVPVVAEQVAKDPDDAARAAVEVGFPVVLKALGKRLAHKTDKGLVRLMLQDEAAVQKAAMEVAAAGGDDVEGLLVQPMVSGNREFSAGFFRDRQFGPVVMFGLGGVFSEALSDVTFRLCPLSETDARRMIEEIRAKTLLKALRGEKPVDRDALVRVLTGLSEIGMQHPDVAEIDVNPLKVMPDGAVVAVDALVVKQEPEKVDRPVHKVPPDRIYACFHPRSIAFVGASAQIGKWGHTLLTLTVAGGYQGPIYLVNRKGGTIAGRKVYTSIAEVPGDVDLAVVTIPAAGVPDLISQFAAKGIRHVLLISSGFGEIGPEGHELEERLVAEARKHDILILGPNTMGICNPHINLYCTGAHVRPLPGGTAVLAQSGNMGTQLLAFAEQQSIGIRGFCGSGNESMVTVEDFLDGFLDDARTRTVMLYVESVKDGRRFFESAKTLSEKKPIVLLKGGRTPEGSTAALSHTGALASDIRLFEAMCRQAGIVTVNHPMDLPDLSAALASLPLPKGNRAAIMTLGGGWGVVAADLCADYGLSVPTLPEDIVEKMDPWLPPYWSRANPVDLVGEFDPELPFKVLDALMAWDGCDAVINLGILGRRFLLSRIADSVLDADPDYSTEFIAALKDQVAGFEKSYIAHIVKRMEQYEKPVVGVTLVFDDEKEKTLYRVAGSGYKGVFYPTPERAVMALAKMFEYQCFKGGSGMACGIRH